MTHSKRAQKGNPRGSLLLPPFPTKPEVSPCPQEEDEEASICMEKEMTLGMTHFPPYTKHRAVIMSQEEAVKGKSEDIKMLRNNNLSDIEITITPVPSAPESLGGYTSDEGGLDEEAPGDGRLRMEVKLRKRDIVAKVCAALGLLYVFVCSLGFLSDAFRLVAGRAAGEALQREQLLNNPIVGVMMGILVTVAVQSSSTSTSIVVSMVSSGIFTVKTAIPIIMGANIGTSVTNTVVALSHMKKREDFQRAFGGAVLHDMFNLLTVSTLLVAEMATSYLDVTSTRIVEMLDLGSDSKRGGGEIQIISRITKPLTSRIIQLNKDVIIGWSVNDPKYDSARLLRVWCNKTELESNNKTEGIVANKCGFLLNLVPWSDLTVGIVLLVISLILLCGCLILLVKVLSSLLKGKLAKVVQKGVNANIPYLPCLTGYLAIGIGAIMTILVQSSSVFTSAMTPLIAMGMISLERAYPLTLGSNLGTTTTAMLAALATEGPNLKLSIQLALCHFLFNLSGILLFYPIPFMRFPIRMAAALGKITATYRWFAIFYLIFMFALLPLAVFSLTLLGPVGFYIVSTPIATLIVLGCLLHTLQSWSWTRTHLLPQRLRTWAFLPKWFRSLEPWDEVVDRIVSTFRLYCTCCKTSKGGGGGGGGVSGTRLVGGLLTHGMRPNNSQIYFANANSSRDSSASELLAAGGTRSPSPAVAVLNSNSSL